MDIFSIVGFAIVATILSIVLKQYKPEFSVAITIMTSLLIFIFTIIQALPIITATIDMFGRTNLSSDYILILIKSLGLSFVTQLASDICKDAGESAIASKVELAGKVAILLLALPLFTKLLDIVYQLIMGI